LKSNISKESEYIKHIQENILDCDLVVWDDIATKLGTEFELSHLLSIIDTRINNGKSNMYTSNLYGVELSKALGDRLYSRIVNYSDAIIELKGRDKRGIKDDTTTNS
jgi:DNA replication protein DnaC